MSLKYGNLTPFMQQEVFGLLPYTADLAAKPPTKVYEP